MNYKLSYKIFHIGIWTGLGCALVFNWLGNSLCSYLGLMVLVVAVLQSFWYYRCPNCNKLLNIGKERPDCCPKCGHKL